MTREEIEEVAENIAHDLVEPPEDDASEAEADDRFRLMEVAWAAAVEVLGRGEGEGAAQAAAAGVVAAARKRMREWCGCPHPHYECLTVRYPDGHPSCGCRLEDDVCMWCGAPLIPGVNSDFCCEGCERAYDHRKGMRG